MRIAATGEKQAVQNMERVSQKKLMAHSRENPNEKQRGRCRQCTNIEKQEKMKSKKMEAAGARVPKQG